MQIYAIAFWICYVLLMLVVYKAWLSKLIKKFKHGNRYLHYHVIDSGDHGDAVFHDGSNIIDGYNRIYAAERIYRGTLFYTEKNAEPLNMVEDIKSYKYYCDTKNFDTITRNDILETLMIIGAKNLLLMVIGIGIAVTVLSAVVNYFALNNMQGDLSNSINAVSNAVTALNTTMSPPGSGGAIIISPLSPGGK